MEIESRAKLIKRAAIVTVLFAVAVGLYLLRGVESYSGLANGLLKAYLIVTSLGLIGAILLQSGRGGGLAAIGGLGTESLFGSHSATPVAKATYVMGALFIVMCALLAVKPAPLGKATSQKPQVTAPEAPPQPGQTPTPQTVPPAEGAPPPAEAPE